MVKAFLKKILQNSGYRVNSTKYIPAPFLNQSNLISLDFDHVISKYIIHKKEEVESFKFVQVGAFDGITCDPLRKYLIKYEWEGIILEPQPGPFSKLQIHYGERKGINVVNAALNASEAKTTLYVLDGNDIPEWSKGMASFNKENILKHSYLIQNLESHIKAIEIDTVSFETLFRRYNIQSLDLLQTDTEGFDAAIIHMFPFHLLKPSIIHFESKHLSKRMLEEVLDKLIGLGYLVARDGAEDIIAILNTK